MEKMKINKNFIILITKEKEFFNIELETALMSNFLKNLYFQFRKESNEDLIIPLYNVETKVLTKIIEYCRYQKNFSSIKDFSKYRDSDFYQKCDWNIEFFKVNKHMIVDMINAAFYLDIKDLLKYATETIANSFVITMDNYQKTNKFFIKK